VTHFDPNNDPARTPPTEPVYSETVETVVVRDSNTGWWIAGVLGGLVLIAVFWILFAGRGPDDTDARMLEAQAEAARAQAAADAAMVQGQITGAQASVDIARADASRAQAEAVRAGNDARAAEARATTPPPPVVITTPPQPAPATVTPNAPQN
tara:strand:+ start:9282 stop:9740 length:459 start_codon:yes stop_codon:yes gene_type:complete